MNGWVVVVVDEVDLEKFPLTNLSTSKIPYLDSTFHVPRRLGTKGEILSHPFLHLGLSLDLRHLSADILLSYYIALVS